jgi:putative phosphoribosyl transferase
MYFRDRREAGRQLAQHLAAYANRPDVIVLALPRGGVPVAYEVARALHAPLDELQELERRERAYRGDLPFPDVRGKTVILVDDGLATGSTMRAAAEALRQQGPARLIVAVPAGSPQTCDEFRDEVDEVVCAITPDPFYAVGLWYDDFSQTTDEEVRALLTAARQEVPAERSA